MPRRKRTKPTSIVPHLTNPSNPSKRKKKPKRAMPQPNTTCPQSPCCNTINAFIASIMKHFLIPSFAFNIIGCMVTCYYIKTDWLHSRWLSGLWTAFSIAIVVMFYSYLYLVLALLFSPMGHDTHSYSVGRAKFHPCRVFAFIYTCFQSFQTLSYFHSYFFDISSCLSQCKRLSLASDLSKMDHASYSLNALKRIVSSANHRVLESMEKQQREQRHYLKQSHYDEIVKQNPNEVLQCAQSKPQHMISIFNVRYDKNDEEQFANLFLPPSRSLSLDSIPSPHKPRNNGSYKPRVLPPTPAIIFLVGGAWGSCDPAFCASAASSFVHAKIAFMYPTYRVYPDGDVGDMLSNIHAMVQWIIKYASALNINPNHLAIVGQSSGAHLGALSILKAHQQKLSWLKRVRLFCGLSGPYCINDHYQWESRRGIENLSPMGRVMKGIHNFVFYSPSTIALELYVMLATKCMDDEAQLQKALTEMKRNLPHFLLIHSVKDYIVPISSSRKFVQYLGKINAECELKEYEHGTHYDSLFGLCDANNCLFHELITDISTRLFICCKQYNEKRDVFASSSFSLQMAPAPDSDAPDMMDMEEVKEHVVESTTSTDSGISDINDHEEDSDPAMDEFYDEAKEEMIRFKARPSVHGDQQIACNGDKDREQSIAIDKQTDHGTLEVAQTLQIVERNEVAASLFSYKDVSIDPTKSDEAIELLQNLSHDLDKASSSVQSTQTQNNAPDMELEAVEEQITECATSTEDSVSDTESLTHSLDEFYDEAKEETVYCKARSVPGEQRLSSNVDSEAQSKYKQRLQIIERQTSGGTDKLEVAQRLQIIERDRNDMVEDKEEGKMDLFGYKDVSIDPGKSDEAIELMRNLLRDMDKALEAVSTFNQATLQ